ncbi:MAG: hypothetical protein COA32_01590 [Fluviicola sp.]|nr:MAG: hypothetical protein COA32_01590 [Fluviicola sp.]
MELNYFNQFSSHKEEKESNNDVWSYTRVSSKEQFDTNKSVENQLDYAERTAKKGNFVITQTFGGTYESAKGDFTRKEFKRLIDEVKKSKKKPYAILIFKMSRFSRTGGGAIGLVHQLIHEMGVNLIETSTGKNTLTERGEHEILESLLYARKENLERLEITIPGMRRFVEKGNWLGCAPRGYDHYGPRVKDPKFICAIQKLEINKEGKLLKRAWIWKLEETPDSVIRTKLSNLGLKVSKQFLSAMWRNPFYCGISVHSFLDGKAIKGNWDSLVSQKDFVRINERLNSKENSGYQQSKFHSERPLQGFVKCGTCNSKLTGYTKKGVYNYYKCSTPSCKTKDMNAKTTCRSKNKGLNDLFKSHLKKFELDPTLKEVFKEQIKLTIKSIEQRGQSQKPSLEKRKAKLELDLKSLRKNLAFGKITNELFEEFNGELVDQLNEINTELVNIQKPTSNLNEKIDKCLDITQNISKHWCCGDVHQKVQIQKLMFPTGIVLNPKKRVYRTKEMNSIFSQIAVISRESKGQKKDPSVKLTDGSSMVAGTRLELMTFGL